MLRGVSPRIPARGRGSRPDRAGHSQGGAWLGQSVVTLASVTIAVVGAHAVVVVDVPTRTAAVRAPARISRESPGFAFMSASTGHEDVASRGS